MTSILNPNDPINKKRNVNGKLLNTLADVSHIPSELRYGYLPSNDENINNSNKKSRHDLEAEEHYKNQDIINKSQMEKNKIENKYLSTASSSYVRPPQPYYDFSKPIKNTRKPGTGLAGHPDLYHRYGNKFIPKVPTYEPLLQDKPPTDKEWEEIPHFAGKKKRKTKRKSLNKRKKTIKRRKNKRKSVRKRKRSN